MTHATGFGSQFGSQTHVFVSRSSPNADVGLSMLSSVSCARVPYFERASAITVA